VAVGLDFWVTKELKKSGPVDLREVLLCVEQSFCAALILPKCGLWISEKIEEKKATSHLKITKGGRHTILGQTNN
jgi:hypothetical protein